MKVQYKVNDDCTIDCDVKDMTQAFQFLSYADTLFGVKECGNCQSPNLRCKHTTPQGKYDYYSVECQDCKYEMKFGQRMEDKRLFPKGWEPGWSGESKNKNEHSRDDSCEYADVGAGGGPDPSEEFPF